MICVRSVLPHYTELYGSKLRFENSITSQLPAELKRVYVYMTLQIVIIVHEPKKRQ